MKRYVMVLISILTAVFLACPVFAQDETTGPGEQTGGPVIEKPAGDDGAAPSVNGDQGGSQSQEGTTSTREEK